MSDLAPSSNGGPECLSDLRLDQLLAGELGGAASAEVQAHLEACASCRARHTDFERQQQDLAADGPDFTTLTARVAGRRGADRARQPRRARVLTAIGGAALAAAAALLLVKAARAPDARAPAATQRTRTKGDADIGYFVKRGNTVLEGVPGTVLYPGDRIRFVTSSTRPRYLAVLNQDGRGVSVYYPSQGDAARLPPGSAVPLGFSVTLDDYVGRERVVAVFCDAPFAVEPLRAALARGELQPGAGCSLATLELNKEAHEETPP